MDRDISAEINTLNRPLKPNPDQPSRTNYSFENEAEAFIKRAVSLE